MTLILCICSFAISLSLRIAGHGLDSWLFWIIFVCYITTCIIAMIREYQLLNAAEIAKRKERRKIHRANTRRTKRIKKQLRACRKKKGKTQESEFIVDIKKKVADEFDLPLWVLENAVTGMEETKGKENNARIYREGTNKEAIR